MTFSIVSGRVIADNTGASKALPVLISESGPVKSLVDYCLSVNRSLAWHEKLVRAAKLWFEYLVAHPQSQEEEWRLFRNFSKALQSGTIDPRTGSDPSDLCWLGSDAREAQKVIRLLTDYFQWLSRENNPRASKFNPLYQGNAYDKRVVEQAYAHRRSQALLGHAWSGVSRSSSHTSTRAERVPQVFPKRPPSFPEDRFEELLCRGFLRSRNPDYRGALISLLQFGGALRVSEAFHVYVADVQPHWANSNSALVAVHHPRLGYAPNKWRNHQGQLGSRQEYLAANFGLTPRHMIRGSHMAGWKNPALDDQWFMHVHWFPEYLGEWFMHIWKAYIETIAMIDRNHPYAWINISRNPGGMYTIKQYEKALQTAVERIGLQYGKPWGTTPHGFRHSYGQRCKRAGISELIIQRLLHHGSPESQTVYTQPDATETMAAIKHASQRLSNNNAALPFVGTAAIA